MSSIFVVSPISKGSCCFGHVEQRFEWSTERSSTGNFLFVRTVILGMYETASLQFSARIIGTVIWKCSRIEL
uniref:Uncharacterized protein n=1 Tax=Pseudomonas fluorescens (strain SBW25) TaxID=216595 RepID=A0A0G4E5I3_PSEFS|nr:hypothetical protein PQBR55_0107 [Pseudomonas fluorescens SBW25]